MKRKATYRFIFDRLNETGWKKERRKPKNPKPTGLIQLEVYHKGERKYISTKIRVKKSDWSDKSQSIRASNSEADNWNTYLRQMINSLETFEAENEGFSLARIGSYLKDGGKEKTFIEYYEQNLKNNKSLRPNTRRAQQYTLNVLKEFKQINFFDDLTLANIRKFNNFLLEKGLTQATIWSHHKQVKVYTNLAII